MSDLPSDPDVLAWLAGATPALAAERAAAYAAGGADAWRTQLEFELLRHFTADFGLDADTARSEVAEALAASPDPEGLLQELVLRARLLVAFGQTSLVG